MWRALVFFDVLSIGAYVCRDHGVTVAWVTMGGIMAFLLPLSKIVSHLDAIRDQQAQQLALLSKILKGYAR